MTTKAIEILIPQRVLEAIELCVENGAQPSRLTAAQVNAALGDDQLAPYLVSCYIKAWRAKNRRVNKLRALIEAASAAAVFIHDDNWGQESVLVNRLLDALRAYGAAPDLKTGDGNDES